MRKIKVAQIGFNSLSHAQQICASIKKQNDLFELVGYALPENEREKFPQLVSLLDGYPEMTVEQILNDPEIEAVIIETEEIYLLKYAIMAAEHKKHIHMEKPGGQNREEFEKLVSILKENKTVFHTGYILIIYNTVRELSNGLSDLWHNEHRHRFSLPVRIFIFLIVQPVFAVPQPHPQNRNRSCRLSCANRFPQVQSEIPFRDTPKPVTASSQFHYVIIISYFYYNS